MPLARADVRDVWFAHWPIPAASLRPRLPAALAPATRDGSAWVSVLVQRTLAGLRGLPGRFGYRQVAVRTYVTPANDRSTDRVGVFFLWVGADSRLASLGGRAVYGLPYVNVSIDVRPRPAGASVRVAGKRSQTDPWDASAARPTYAAAFDRRGEPAPAATDSPVGWLTERYRYYRADGRAGAVSHDPWRLADVAGHVEAAPLFEAVGIDRPDAAPVCRYSPGTDVFLVERPGRR